MGPLINVKQRRASIASKAVDRGTATVRNGSASTLAFKERDVGGFTAIVERWDEELVRLCYLVLRDPDAANDAVQNVWARLWRKPPQLRDPGALGAWLRKVALNEARSIGRKDSALRALHLRAARAATDNAHALEREKDAGVALSQALAEMSPDERALLGLRYISDLTSAEIGEQVGLSAAGVRSRLHRTIGRLREEFDHAFAELE